MATGCRTIGSSPTASTRTTPSTPSRIPTRTGSRPWQSTNRTSTPSIAVAVGAGTYDAALALPYAYLASAADLRVLDLSDPAHPLYRGRFGAGLFMTETIIEPGGLLFTTQVRPDTPMPIFRLSDPVQPAFISDVVFSDLGLGPGDTTGLAADGSYVYATATRGFEAAYKPGTAGDTRFYVARYLGIDDTAGLPPTVAITSPAPGAAFQETTTVPVAVAASDDVAVARVELLADGEVVSTAAAPPSRSASRCRWARRR